MSQHLMRRPHQLLMLTWPLGIAAHDLDLLGLEFALLVDIEVDILDEECPDFVTEAICIQTAL